MRRSLSAEGCLSIVCVCGWLDDMMCQHMAPFFCHVCFCSGCAALSLGAIGCDVNICRSV